MGLAPRIFLGEVSTLADVSLEEDEGVTVGGGATLWCAVLWPPQAESNVNPTERTANTARGTRGDALAKHRLPTAKCRLTSCASPCGRRPVAASRWPRAGRCWSAAGSPEPVRR